MNELEKACEKIKKEIYGDFKDNAERRLGFEYGFNEALKPEHMKLTEEVKGLIESINEYFEADGSIGSENIDKALKPFEKEE